jgi:aminomuconate-semialdehyde/2-hydroxymuconate-6-semialdehyde dehydrogenase
MEVIGHVIDGEETESSSGARFDTIDPWIQQAWAQVALGGPEEAGRAVGAARRAFDDGPWPRMGFAERGAILHRLADLVIDNAEELALADTTDMGKPLGDSRGNDVPRAALNLRFFADHARLATGEVLPMDTGHHAYTRFEPAGVVAAIAPWNFPLMLETWKIAPALAWGNTVVLKPAEDTPTSATVLARLALAAGMPAGVLNVVHGYGPDSVGSALTRDSRVDRITFTGESGTGRVIAGAAAAHLTPVSLELGGKGANLVFADADLDTAVHWSIRAIFSNAGQVCLAGSRLYVQHAVYEEFLTKFVAAAESLTIGDPKRAGTQIGPLASEKHWKKVRDYVEGVGAEGGTVRTGGLAGGWAIRPTVVTGVSASARVCREEIFGPVVVVQPFDSEADGIAAANDTPYGLNAMVFTESLSRAHRTAAALNAGTIWVNCFFIRDLRAPFGGVGDSGIGREGGGFSREFFTEPKAVVMAVDAANGH